MTDEIDCPELVTKMYANNRDLTKKLRRVQTDLYMVKWGIGVLLVLSVVF